MVGISALIAGAAIQTNRAADILARSQDILGKAETVVGKFSQRMPRGIGKGDFVLKKDRKLAVHSDRIDEMCDGNTRITFDHKTGKYTSRDVRVFDLVYMPGFEGFTHTERPAPPDHATWSLIDKFAQDASNEKRAMEPKDVKMGRMDGKEVASYVVGGTTVYLDPRTALPVGADFVGENSLSVRMRFSNVRLNDRVDDSMFTNRSGVEERVIEQGMLREGDRVPNSQSEAMRMIDRYTSNKKSSVIVFFDDQNAADSDILKFMNDMTKRAPKDVAVVAVAMTNSWQKMFKGKTKYPVVVDSGLSGDSARAQYRVTKYPTVFVVDQDRVIRYVQIGTASEGLSDSLSGIGFAKP